MCRPVEVLLPSFVLFSFVRSVELGGVCVFIGWQPFYSPSTVFSLATQELSSVTVVSSRVHSFSRVSTFLTQSSDTALTLLYFSLRAATSLSASSWVVIFLEADSAATSTAK